MQSFQVRKKFLGFFKGKGHKIMPSSSLLPKDLTVLFTSAGMQQFIPYLTGEKNPLLAFGTRHLASCQKCFRTDDIEKVGDETHHTFFEMLGNWSIGQEPKTGYFKEGAIKYALEFFIDELGLKRDRIWVTIFKGENNIPQDKESFQLWQENGILKDKIREFGMKENFWGPVGEKRGPCGPSSEIYYDRGEKFGCKRNDCGPNCPNCNRFFELWNLVFMEYQKNEDGTFEKLPQKNIDTGIGFERLVAVLQGKESAYETDLFLPIINSLEESSHEKYQAEKNIFRIIADHLRGSVFLISEGILPSNLDRGYILRRLLRLCISYAKLLKFVENWYVEPIKETIEIYSNVYPEIKSEEEKIITVIQREEEKYSKTIKKGFEVFDYKILRRQPDKKGVGSAWDQRMLYGDDAFFIYQTYGFPPDFMRTICKEKGIKFDEEGFRRAKEKHKEISRAGVEKKFKGGMIDESKETIKLHTATHLLLQALREILGNHVYQMGSNITPERLRFDFSHSQKLTPNQIKKVEDLINKKIRERLPVSFKEMNLEEAKREGAIGVFEEKYGNNVKVYQISDFSKEICGGPHVKNTGELGQFKITKEESLGTGKRRIRAVLI